MFAGKMSLRTQLTRPTYSGNRAKAAASIVAALVIWFAPAMAICQDLGQAGLKQQWFSNSGAESGLGLVDWHLDVDENDSTTFFTISGGDYTETFSQHDIGPNGQPYGIAGGLQIANINKEIAEKKLLARTGKETEVVVTQYTLPKTTLYTQTNRGIVRSIDGETGKVRWSAHIGSAGQDNYGVAGRGNRVAALNGSKVYCLSAETGAVLWSRECATVPSAPPEINEEDIFVPLFDGRLERFNMAKEGFASVVFVSGGASTARPSISRLSAAWGDSKGRLSIASHLARRGGISVQLKTDGPILGEPEYKDGIYFATSQDGYIYAMSERQGSLIWENSTGIGISQSPIPVGDQVFVINDNEELHRFDAKTGRADSAWQKPRHGVGRFSGASQTKLYVVNGAGQLQALDQANGSVVGMANLGNVHRTMPNLKTDRIYVLGSEGTIRCLREIAADRPFFHSDEYTATPKKKDSVKEGDGPSEDITNPFASDSNEDDSNPFGGSEPKMEDGDTSDGDADADDSGADDDSDPFADSSTSDTDAPSEDDEDPFGDSDMPSEDNDDPFGS